MKHPWHYWLMYVLGLVFVTVTLGWLTHEALELDRAEASARHQAEVEENVGRALWRMDVRLMPLIATEAARPHFLYQAFYVPPDASGGKAPPRTSPSPLLTKRPEFVVLNFQVNPTDQWSSAQLPTSDKRADAIQCGVLPADMLRCETNLAQLRDDVTYPALLGLLPVESVTDVWTESIAADSANGNSQAKVVTNAVVDENLAKQTDGSSIQSEQPQQGVDQQRGSNDSLRTQRQQIASTSDLANRGAKFQNLAQREFENQRANYKVATEANAREGISRPVWIGSRLLLARRVELDGQVVIQGCWLDWPRIKQVLVAEAADLLPTLELEPVVDAASARVNRMLATLPVQLVVPPSLDAGAWTAMRTTLAIAWLCVAAIAVAGGLLLHGVLSLSERRAAFVSAVTHELRTPLTTFRLYSEILAEGMLPDEKQRQRYLETLRVEADRLARLVDNVLSYARLERGRAGSHREPITVQALLDRCLERLTERATQAGLALSPDSELDLADVTVVTDAAAVEQILFNLVDNAAKYAGRCQDRRLHLEIARGEHRITIRLRDHGPGVSHQVERRLFQPFSKSAEDAAHSAPGVGLGLALSRRLARELGGQLALEHNSSAGATFLLTLPIQRMTKSQ